MNKNDVDKCRFGGYNKCNLLYIYQKIVQKRP